MRIYPALLPGEGVEKGVDTELISIEKGDGERGELRDTSDLGRAVDRKWRSFQNGAKHL